MPSSGYIPCFYCSEYSKIAQDYPINFATKDKDTFTPRCSLHWEFECSKCGKTRHFNGISWCSSCKIFTCIKCGNEKIQKEEFLMYNYYYSIPCHKCGTYNPALDFAEYEGKHPYQIGDLTPEEEIVIWMPIYKDKYLPQEFPHKAWGLQRILSLGKQVEFKRLDSLEGHSPKLTWDNLSSVWIPPENEEEYHHTHKILPNVYRMLDVQEGEKILDVACGQGNLSRHAARKGAEVIGIDISKMIEHAINIEKEEKLGIRYMKLNAERLTDEFKESSFDKVVCNMALMDFEDYKTTIEQISAILKENGIFVFSITHPAFAWPTGTTFRVPKGSQRNEDKLRILLNYFDERPTLIEYFPDLPNLQFPRTISSYVNELAKNKLVIIEICEPKASEELVQEFPRQAYMDDDTFPDFLIFKMIKKSNL